MFEWTARFLMLLLLATVAFTLNGAEGALRSAMLGTTAISRRLDIVEVRLDALQVCAEIDLTDSDKLAALEWAVIRLESAHRRER